MRYINFEGHHYGFYVSYSEARLKVTLVENKQKVCDLTSFSYYSKIAQFDTGYAFVNVDKIEYAKRLLEELGCKPTGETHKLLDGTTIVEYDFSPLVKFDNREMNRHKMKWGMVEINDGIYVSSSVIYYAHHNKKKNEYRIYTTQSLSWIVPKDKWVAAVRDYNIPVYRSVRKEPF